MSTPAGRRRGPKKGEKGGEAGRTQSEKMNRGKEGRGGEAEGRLMLQAGRFNVGHLME